ncbi:hypothetical protein LINPERHAP1_LOCUS23784 [Linum perenne]
MEGEIEVIRWVGSVEVGVDDGDGKASGVEDVCKLKHRGYVTLGCFFPLDCLNWVDEFGYGSWVNKEGIVSHSRREVANVDNDDLVGINYSAGSSNGQRRLIDYSLI